jgi:hypothetical protein
MAERFGTAVDLHTCQQFMFYRNPVNELSYVSGAITIISKPT